MTLVETYEWLHSLLAVRWETPAQVFFLNIVGRVDALFFEDRIPAHFAAHKPKDRHQNIRAVSHTTLPGYICRKENGTSVFTSVFN